MEFIGRLPDRITRQAYLAKLFSQRIDFTHRNRTFVYVPIGTEGYGDGKILLGRIGRAIDAVENSPPESAFEETTRTSWRAANVLIDTRDHTDGQKVAFQYHSNVGKPLPIASSLIYHLNEANKDSGWQIEINAITEQQSFWDAVRKHQGEITTAEFTFVTPNILGIRSKLNDELKNRRINNNATSVTETLHNPDGNLNLSGEAIEDSVEYISEGGGKTKLKSGSTIIYDSEKQEKSTEVDDDEPLSTEKTSMWKNIIDKLFS